MSTQKTVSNPNKDRGSLVVVAIVATVCALIGLSVWWVSTNNQLIGDSNLSNNVRAQYVQSQDEGAYIKFSSTDNPRHILDLFTDPMCSHCVKLEQVAGSKFKEYVETDGIELRVHPMTFTGDQTSDYSAQFFETMMILANNSDGAAAWRVYNKSFDTRGDHYGETLNADQLVNIAQKNGASEQSLDQVSKITKGDTAREAGNLNITVMELHQNIEYPATPTLVLDGSGVVQDPVNLESWTGYVEDTWTEEDLRKSKEDADKYLGSR